MPRNKSEKLPAFAEIWSEEGISMCKVFGEALAEVYGVSEHHIIADGRWGTGALSKVIHLFVGKAQRDYNMRRGQSYQLVAHFFMVAHGKKPK